MVIRAVVKNGMLQPMEPLPPFLKEGMEIDLDAPEAEPAGDSWDELERLCAQGDPAEDARMMRAINEHRAEQKELMRRRMGLAS